MLNEKFSSCGLNAYPHINSKTKWFRHKYNVITKMLRTSEYSWNDTIKMIKCERQLYKDICGVNSLPFLLIGALLLSCLPVICDLHSFL